MLVSVSRALLPIAKAAADFARAHTGRVKMATVGLLIAAAVLTIGGALALAGAAVAGFGAVLPILAVLASSAGVAATAVTGLNAAMLLNPVGLVIAGVVALGVALYELIQHWGAVSAAVGGAFTAIGSVFGSSMFEAGAHLMGELTRGIASAAMAPVHAVEAVAHRIRAYLPFSPAKVGPLRDLRHVRISETIAETIRPGPLSAAMRKATAALAVIVPVAFATPAMARGHRGAGIPGIAARAPELTLGRVAPASGATATTAITLNVSPTINIATREMDERRVARLVGDEIEKRGHEIARVLRRQAANTNRLEF